MSAPKVQVSGKFLQGLSAYEVAVKNGFEGTEQEWLASLKGGSAGGFNKIINVNELPTEDIDPSALYRLDYVNLYLGTNVVENFVCEYVVELPSEGENACTDYNYPYGWHCYHNRTNGQTYGYVSIDMASKYGIEAGWALFDEIVNTVTFWSVITVTDPSKINAGILFNLLIQSGIYFYKDEKWQTAIFSYRHEHNNYTTVDEVDSKIYQALNEFQTPEACWNEERIAFGYIEGCDYDEDENELPRYYFRINTGVTLSKLKEYESFAVMLWGNYHDIPLDGCKFIFNSENVYGDISLVTFTKGSQLAIFKWADSNRKVLLYEGGTCGTYYFFDLLGDGKTLSTCGLTVTDEAAIDAVMMCDPTGGSWATDQVLYIDYLGDEMQGDYRWQIRGLKK